MAVWGPQANGGFPEVETSKAGLNPNPASGYRRQKANSYQQQGLAVLAYSLEDYFKPPFPDWLMEGLANEKSLPWIEEAAEVARQAALYKARPHCEIDRNFARILRTRLREFFENCSDQAIVSFHFDGQLLSVDFSATPLVIPASGKAWTDDFSVRANAMIELPSRFRRGKVVVGIWSEELEFDDQRYPLYHPSNHSPNLPGIDV